MDNLRLVLLQYGTSFDLSVYPKSGEVYVSMGDYDNQNVDLLSREDAIRIVEFLREQFKL